MKNIVRGEDQIGETNESGHEKASSKEKEKTKNKNKIRRRSATEQNRPRKKEAPTKDFVIDKIVEHNTYTIGRHQPAKAGEPLYHVRWYGY